MLEKLKPLSGCNGVEGTGDPGNAFIAGFIIGSTKGQLAVIGVTTATTAGTSFAVAVSLAGCATGGTSGVVVTCGLSKGITAAYYQAIIESVVVKVGMSICAGAEVVATTSSGTDDVVTVGPRQSFNQKSPASASYALVYAGDSVGYVAIMMSS